MNYSIVMKKDEKKGNPMYKNEILSVCLLYKRSVQIDSLEAIIVQF